MTTILTIAMERVYCNGFSPIPMTAFFTKKSFSCASIAFLLALAACGSPDTAEQPTEENAEGTNLNIGIDTDARVHVVTSAGSFDGGTTIPEDWPDDVPPYTGATVDYATAVMTPEGDAGLALTLSTGDTAEQVVEFYRETLASQGWTIQATLQSGDGSVIAAEKDDRALAVSVASADGKTTISLGLGKRD